MKKLDGQSLFNIFQVGDEAVYKEHGVEDLLDNSFIILGMVLNGFQNYNIIDEMYLQKYGKSYLSVRENIKVEYFSRLVKYLERLNDLKGDTISLLKDEFGEDLILEIFGELLKFLESIENYEECIVVKNCLDFFQEKVVE